MWQKFPDLLQNILNSKEILVVILALSDKIESHFPTVDTVDKIPIRF